MFNNVVVGSDPRTGGRDASRSVAAPLLVFPPADDSTSSGARRSAAASNA